MHYLTAQTVVLIITLTNLDLHYKIARKETGSEAFWNVTLCRWVRGPRPALGPNSSPVQCLPDILSPVVK
jgi:hypothetical protein